MSSAIVSPTPLEIRHASSNPSINLLTPSPLTRAPNATLTPTRRGSPQPLSMVSVPGRLPSSRPSSIPSSPTSVHSSSSAIFERDIEQISLAPSPQRPDPHRVSRAITHEAVDASVPTVLDSAVSALTHSDGSNRSPQEEISIIAPAPVHLSGLGSSQAAGGSIFASSGIASPANIASRSPSPTGTHTSTNNAGNASPNFVPRPLMSERRADSTGLSSPTLALPSQASPSHANATLPTVSSISPSPRPQKSHSLPSPDDPFQSTSNKRLSFVSYHDLLLSTPVATTTLSAITSPNEPPPHIPPILAPHPSISISSGGGSPVGSVSREAVDSEWGREGLGRGLEDRLEEVLAANSAAAPTKS